jgi:DNA-binding CsgD family transcriptional regulator/N-acetylneuraminic acid mutarotase
MTENKLAELSERELEILRLVATGASNKEIAQQLFISTNTVKVHLRNIFAKVGVASRTEAAMYCVRLGLVEEPVYNLTGSDDQSTILTTPASEQAWSGKLSDTLNSKIGRKAIMGTLIGVLVVTLFAGVLVRMIFPVMADNQEAIDAGVQNSDNRWKLLPKMPNSRQRAAVAVYENKIFVIGGRDESGVISTNQMYSIDETQWYSLSSKPDPVSDAHAGLVGGLIYIPGGQLSSGQLTGTMDVYDPKQDVWEKRAALPKALSGYALISYEGSLYIFGGWDGDQYLSSVYRYDPRLDVWEELTPMPTARAYAAAAVAHGKIYIMGGYDGDKALSVNEVYQPDLEGTDRPWIQARELPDARYGVGVASIADIIQVFGGLTDGSERLPAISYSPSIDEWYLLDSPIQTIGAFMGAGVSGGNVYLIGGEINGDVTASVIKFESIYTISIPIIVK